MFFVSRKTGGSSNFSIFNMNYSFIIPGKVGLTAKASRRQNSGSDSSSTSSTGQDEDGKYHMKDDSC